MAQTTDHGSLAIALKSNRGVILAADTRVIRHPDGMNYAEEGFSKLCMFGECCAAAATGDVGLMEDFLKRALDGRKAFNSEKSPSDTVAELEQFFRGLYRDRFSDASDPLEHTPTAVLLAGHGTFAGQRHTFIYRMDLSDLFFFRLEPRHAPAGQHKHGGLYYLNRFYRDDMNQKEAAFLAYLCIREVASLDATVSPKVEIIACSDTGANWVSREWLEEFRLRHDNAHLQMTNWFSINE